MILTTKTVSASTSNDTVKLIRANNELTTKTIQADTTSQSSSVELVTHNIYETLMPTSPNVSIKGVTTVDITSSSNVHIQSIPGFINKLSILVVYYIHILETETINGTCTLSSDSKIKYNGKCRCNINVESNIYGQSMLYGYTHKVKNIYVS
jgi:hypothetical protein